MLKALRKPSIALLWSGQMLSAVGDEIYRVALVWLAVGLIGTNTGYLDAGRFAAVLVLSIIGGKWFDQWDHFRTMIGVDLLRAAVVLIPVVLFHFGPVSMPVLWIVALTVSGLSAGFDPAMMATLPNVSEDTESLQAATGLMSTTYRLARVVGPGIVGALSPVISTLHFFTLDSLSFAVSAASIALLRSRLPKDSRNKHRPRTTFRKSLTDGLRAVSKSRVMSYALFAKTVGGGIWSLAYLLGVALLVHQVAPTDVRAYGLVAATYGVGNFASAMFYGNMKRNRPTVLLYSGNLVLAFGFLAIGFAPSLFWIAVACALSGWGGVMYELPFIDLLQSRFPREEISKIYRLRLALETFATMVFMALSPTLFRMFSIQSTIAGCGGALLILSGMGFTQFLHEEAPARSRSTAPSGI